MNHLKWTLTFVALSLSACGGGGGSKDTASATSSGSSGQTYVTQQVNDMTSAFKQRQDAPGATNLTGTWIEAAGDVGTASGKYNGSSLNSSWQDLGVQIYQVVDNGPNLTVTPCDTPSTHYTFTYNASGQVVQNSSDPYSPVGDVTGNNDINFGVTPYTYHVTETTSDYTTQGQSTLHWIKLSTSLTANVGYISATGMSANLTCAYYYQSNYKLSGVAHHEYEVFMQDDNSNQYYATGGDSDALPTRTGNVFSLTYKGVPVTVTLY